MPMGEHLATPLKGSGYNESISMRFFFPFFSFEKPSAIQQRAIIPCIKGSLIFAFVVLVLDCCHTSLRARCDCASPVWDRQDGHLCHFHPSGRGHHQEDLPGSGAGSDQRAGSADPKGIPPYRESTGDAELSVWSTGCDCTGRLPGCSVPCLHWRHQCED